MSSQVDARGLSCPQPVVLTQKAIKEGKTSFEVLVSNAVSKENVLRCVQNNKMKAEVVEDGDEFKIIVSQ